MSAPIDITEVQAAAATAIANATYFSGLTVIADDGKPGVTGLDHQRNDVAQGRVALHHHDARTPAQ